MTEVERGSGLGSCIKAILYNPTKAATFFFLITLIGLMNMEKLEQV